VTIPNPMKSDWKKVFVQTGLMQLERRADGLELSADLPGMEEKDIEIVVSDNQLIVRGERRVLPGPAAATDPVQANRFTVFSRSIDLPEGVHTDEISAVLEMGRLKVNIPAPAKRDFKRIEVRSAA
jgi:HSP20 family protein